MPINRVAGIRRRPCKKPVGDNFDRGTLTNGEPELNKTTSSTTTHSSTSDNPSNQRIANIKPPKFTEDNAIAWFKIVNAQFIYNNITSQQTKFYFTLGNLPMDIVGELDTSTMEGEDYDNLKDAVIRLCGKTKSQMFESLLAESAVVDKPSKFIRDMKQTASRLGFNNDVNGLIRHKLVQCMPSYVAPVLAAQTSLSLDQLGQLADDLTVLNISTGSCVNHVTSNDNKRVSSILNADKRTLTPFREGQRPKLCRFHLFYGKTANKCTKWCQWQGEKPLNVVSRENSRPNSPHIQTTSPNHKCGAWGGLTSCHCHN